MFAMWGGISIIGDMIFYLLIIVLLLVPTYISFYVLKPKNYEKCFMYLHNKQVQLIEND